MPERTPEVFVGPRLVPWALLRALAALLPAMLLLGVSPVHASFGLPSYDTLTAESMLTTVGGPFATGTPTSAVAFSPDGKLFVSANHDANTVTVSSVGADGSIMSHPNTYTTGNGPSAVAFTPDQRLLAVANQTDSTLQMYWVTLDMYGTGGTLSPAGPAQALNGTGPASLAFTRDSRFLAVANRGDRSVMVYSVSDGGVISDGAGPPGYPVGGGEVKTVRFSSLNVLAIGIDFPQDSFYFYRLGSNGGLTPTGEIHDANADLCDGQFSPDGTKFAYSDCYYAYNIVKVRPITADGSPDDDFLTQKNLHLCPIRPTGLAWGPDNSTLAVATTPSTLCGLGSTQTAVPGNTIALFSITDSGFTLLGNPVPTGANPTIVAQPPSGGLLAVVSEAGTSTYRVSHQRLVPIGAPTRAFGGTAGQTTFSADGALLATATDVFSVASDGTLTPASGNSPTAAATSDAFSPNGSLLARAVGDTVTLSSVSASGALTAIGEAQPASAASDVAFNAEGTLLAATDRSGVSTFSVSPMTGLQLASRRTWSGASPESVAFQPGGTTLAVADDTARLITVSVSSDGTLGNPVFTPVSAGSDANVALQEVAFSIDGGLLAAGDGAQRLWLFRIAADGTPSVATMKSLTMWPYGLRFSPTVADTLVVGTSSGIAVFDTAGGQLRQIAAPSGEAGGNGLALSPDGKRATGDGIMMWSLTAPWMALRATDPGPSGLIQSDQATVAFAANYPTRFECRLDDGAFQTCTSPWTFSDVPDGTHIATVRARDLSGAVQGDPLTWSWKSDVHGPAAAGLSTPVVNATNLPANGQKFTWQATTDIVSPVSHYELLIDHGMVADVAASTCSATCTATASGALANGGHSWSVRAYDSLGHMTETAARGFTVDAVPPSAPALTSPDDGAYVADSRPRLAWSLAQDGAAGITGYDVIVDGQPASDGLASPDSSWTPPAALGEGAHSWQVLAKDGAGNSTTSPRRTFTVDQTPPTASLRVSPERFVPPFKVTLDASASTDPNGGAIARYEFDLDGNGTYETVSASPRAEVQLTTLGQHPLGLRVVDQVGHDAIAAATAVGEAVTGQDAHEASVTVNDQAEYTRSRTVSLTIHPPPRSGAVTMIISNDGAPDQTLRRPVATHVNGWSLAKGDGLRDRRIVYVTFYNSAGLQVTNGRVSDDILYDPYAPTVSEPVLRVTGPQTATLSFHAKDRGSGLARWKLTAGKSVLARRSRFSGAHRVTLSKRVPSRMRLVLRDKAGNTTSAAVRIRHRR
jgi:6-phosphogluconolactonase (cycloisomerase 2 family)